MVAVVNDTQQTTGNPISNYSSPISTPALRIPHFMANPIGIPRLSPVHRTKGEAWMDEMPQQV